MNSIYGKKIGMTRIFTPAGDSVGVTAIEIEPLTVVRVKTEEDRRLLLSGSIFRQGQANSRHQAG